MAKQASASSSRNTNNVTDRRRTSAMPGLLPSVDSTLSEHIVSYMVDKARSCVKYKWRRERTDIRLSLRLSCTCGRAALACRRHRGTTSSLRPHCQLLSLSSLELQAQQLETIRYLETTAPGELVIRHTHVSIVPPASSTPTSSSISLSSPFQAVVNECGQSTPL